MLPALAFLANPAFWSGASSAAGAAGGIASMFGIGKKKSGGETVKPESLIPDFQLKAGRDIADYVSKYLGQYKPGKEFTGDFTAPVGEAETAGLEKLNRFLAAPELGGLFGAAEQNVLDTLGGRFANPAESPFIQSMVNLSKMNLSDLVDESRRSAGSRGAYFTRSAQEGENRLRERVANALNAEVGKFIETERGRQMQAVPYAAALEKYKTLEAPLTKIEASQTFGSLPRMIQQAQLEAEYGDFKRKQLELSGVPQQAQSLFGTNTPYGVGSVRAPIEESNPLASILQSISKLNLSSLGGKGTLLEKLGGVFSKGRA